MRVAAVMALAGIEDWAALREIAQRHPNELVRKAAAYFLSAPVKRFKRATALAARPGMAPKKTLCAIGVRERRSGERHQDFGA